MSLAYEPSLSDGRYQVSGMIGNRSQIFTKDSGLKKLLQEFFLLPLIFILYNYFVWYIGQVIMWFNRKNDNLSYVLYKVVT